MEDFPPSVSEHFVPPKISERIFRAFHNRQHTLRSYRVGHLLINRIRDDFILQAGQFVAQSRIILVQILRILQLRMETLRYKNGHNPLFGGF